jgi:hypothetical protein
MSSFGKKVRTPRTPRGRRAAARRQVGLAASVVTINGSKPALVEDICPEGAKLLGRHLPQPGDEILLRTDELAVFGTIGWASGDRRGVVFDDDEKPNAATCLGLQLRSAA